MLQLKVNFILFLIAKEIGFDSNVRTLCGTSEYMAP